MDRERFDALARLLATTGSRRAGLGVLLGAGLLVRNLDALAKPGKGSGRGRKRRKTRRKRGRRDQASDQTPESPSAAGCGTRQCVPPKPGSIRAECDFAGQSFAGQVLHGSIFTRIDGRRTSFDDTDNHGSVFAEACLKGATFRGAKLLGSTWRDACLIAAEFTGADLGNDPATFDDAVLCATVMPDGTVRNDDCPAGVDPEDVCCADSDCGAARACRNQACVPDPGSCAAGEDFCRDGRSRCGNDSGCRCRTTTNGATFCGKGGFCSNCSSDDDCAAVTGLGSVCTVSSSPFCGCGPTQRRACVPPCGQQCANNAQCGGDRICCDGTCADECCTSADCGANETCEGGFCICQGCIGRINSQCLAGDTWAQCGTDSARCAECNRGQVCAAGRQTCVSCDFGGASGTWCEVRDGFAKFQCAPNCACATDPQGFGACFSTTIAGVCNRGGEPICEFRADCVIEGLGTDCIVVGDCETCTTACVTGCTGDESPGSGPLRLVVLD